MAGPAFSRIYSITLKQNYRISVDVDRYTFVFLGRPSDARLDCIAEMIWGKNRGEIDPEDSAAIIARVEAHNAALQQLRRWATANPEMSQAKISNLVIWPEALTAAEEVALFIASLKSQLGLFPPDQEHLS